MKILFFTLFCIAASNLHFSSATQTFLEKPKPTVSVNLGATVTLPCKIANLSGMVMWTKNGIVLGLKGKLFNMPRYKMKHTKTDFSLTISKTNLSDDANFSCQATEAYKDGKTIPSILAETILIVQIAPNHPSIFGKSPHGTIKASVTERNFQLTCLCTGGRPPATIKWFRGDKQITENVIRTFARNHNNKITNVTSVLSFKPNRSLEGTYFCEASHPTFASPERDKVEVVMLFPPGKPTIQVISGKGPLRVSESLTLMCESRGGNPPAELKWLKNGEPLDTTYTTQVGIARNQLRLTNVSGDDNWANIRCEASNAATKDITRLGLFATYRMDVYYKPVKVKIFGKSTTKAKSPVNWSCAAGPANPKPSVVWMWDTDIMPNTFTEYTTVATGYIASTNISARVVSGDRSVYTCRVSVSGVGVSQLSKSLNIQKAPVSTELSISGLSGESDNPPWPKDDFVKLNCVVEGGNPTPKVSWTRNGKPPDSVEQRRIETWNYTNKIVSQWTVVAKQEDNGAVFKCKGYNKVGKKEDKLNLKVWFPPSSVVITTDKSKLKVGTTLELTCTSSSSYPSAIIKWYKNGAELRSTGVSTKPGKNGGNISENSIKLKLTAQDNGAAIKCSAINEKVQKAAHTVKYLNVLHKPMFSSHSAGVIERVFVASRTEQLVINITAVANPPIKTFRWAKDGKKIKKSQRFVIKSNLLVIKNMSESDAGVYKLSASNKQGRNDITFKVLVKHLPKIKPVHSKPIMIGGSAELKCSFSAYPDVTRYEWYKGKKRLIKGRFSPELKRKSAVLTLSNVEISDAGLYECRLWNVIGRKSGFPLLKVKFGPQIDKAAIYQKAATDDGETARVLCRARCGSFPPDKTEFKWDRKGVSLKNGSKKYDIYTSENKKDSFLKQSQLLVHDITASDYGSYTCTVKNSLGTATTEVLLQKKSRPDPPTAFAALSATHNTILLSWKPGFDGGYLQKFEIRYKKEDSKSPRTVEVYPPEASEFNLSSLHPTSRYIISIRSSNRLGFSPYVGDIIMATKQFPADLYSSHLSKDSPSSTVVVLSLILAVLVLLIVAFMVIVFLVRKRSKAPDSETTVSENLSSPSNFVEVTHVPFCHDDNLSMEMSVSLNSDDIEHYKQYLLRSEDEQLRVTIPQNNYEMLPPICRKNDNLPLDLIAHAQQRSSPNNTLTRSKPLPVLHQPPNNSSSFETSSSIPYSIPISATRPSPSYQSNTNSSFEPSPPQPTSSQHQHPPLTQYRSTPPLSSISSINSYRGAQLGPQPPMHSSLMTLTRNQVAPDRVSARTVQARDIPSTTVRAHLV